MTEPTQIINGDEALILEWKRKPPPKWYEIWWIRWPISAALAAGVYMFGMAILP